MRARILFAVLTSSVLAVGTLSPASASVGPTADPCVQPNGRVTSVVVSSGTTYIGGSFTEVKDRQGAFRPRARLAAVDTTTCDLLPWSPNADGEVDALEVVDGTVYAGGLFLNVGGQTRTRLAAVDASSGEVLPFDPIVDKPVKTLVASGTTLYAGGDFTRVEGSARSKLAAFSLTTGNLDPSWTPSANAAVFTLALGSGDRVYAGGNFTSLNGQSMPYIGALDAATGATEAGFTPSFGSSAPFPMIGLAADSRGVYAGAGGSGGHLVIWNLDGSLQRPIYQTDGGVQSVSVDGDSLFAGGHFTNYCAGNTGSGHPFVCDTNVPRRKLFEVSLTTGQLTNWAPTLNSPRGVFGSDVDPATHALWVGGDFTKVKGKTVNHLARFS